jgi:CheY-like chemotaxis protein
MEALGILEERSADVVIMDVQMPEMDGLETTRRIRAGRASNVDPAMPIVALTAYAMKGDRENILQAGVDAYITKPAEAETLAAVIKTILHRKGRLSAAGGNGRDNAV